MRLSIEPTNQLQLVKEIADRMRNPDHVKEMIFHPDNHNSKPLFESSAWGGVSLEGYSGPLLLFAELDRLFPTEKWDEAAHSYALKIKTTIEKEGIHRLNCSLFGGLAGTCFALRQASKEGSRYRRLIETLSKHLFEKVKRYPLFQLKEHLKEGSACPIFLYDLIQGIVGIGAHGLNHLSDPNLLHFTEELARVLIQLTKPIQVAGKWVPGWYVPSQYQLVEEDKGRYPLGNFNLGLSHGVTGILAFLSIAHLCGLFVEGLKEAIERIVNWLKCKRKSDRKNLFWPAVISFEEEIANKIDQESHFSGRDAWCYGSPGVARTLFLAGLALRDDSLQCFALESFRSVFQRSREQWWLPGPTFCHGISGLMLITLQMAKDTKGQDLKENVILLNQILLDFYSPEYPFGFKDYDPCVGGEYVMIDKVGLLEGASGILLSLLCLGNPTSWWYAPFLI